MRNILTSMIIAVVISMALIGMAGADPFTYLGKDTTRMNYDLQTTKDACVLMCTVASGLTNGNGGVLCANNSTSARLWLSAEL